MLWRTGERELLMQGYLKELAWQNGLFESAHREASKHEVSKTSVQPQRPYLFEPEVEGESLKPLGVAWAIPQNPFVQVELTDLRLLEATGIWTEPRLPENAESIAGPFLKLLENLDVLLGNDPPESEASLLDS